MLREFEITCPTCNGWILIDLESGEVLRHGKKGEVKGERAGKVKSLNDALDRMNAREAAGDSKFEDAIDAVDKAKQRLEDAFEEARKKAKKRPDDRPVNPFNDLFGD